MPDTRVLQTVLRIDRNFDSDGSLGENGGTALGRHPLTREDSSKATVPFTAKQGQYLAYIHLYRRLHRRGPSEADIGEYFRVSPPTVHQMIVTLEKKGLVAREAGVPRSVRVAVPASDLPDLPDEEG